MNNMQQNSHIENDLQHQIPILDQNGGYFPTISYNLVDRIAGESNSNSQDNQAINQ